MNPITVSSITKAHLNQVREHYEDQAPLTRAALHYREILAHYYNLLIPANASVLEVGCGSGELLCRLNGSSKCGVDLCPSQVERARVRLPAAEFYVQAGEELNLPEKQFDYIVVS